MRLINTSTYQLESHLEPESYAILSHTWRQEEVLYTDFIAGSYQNKQGSQKIEYLCAQARKDGLKYAWMDTVCIDKDSSAELSGAINSMCDWYKNAKVCYAYVDDADVVSDIQSSWWITRGWTLQELIAPSVVMFFNRDWTLLGTKSLLMALLVQWTSIDQIVLGAPASLERVSAATRMPWAASRNTTRVEDRAYSLLGIFGVNLPLIYGEKARAFRRLQEEILRQRRDVSILAFDRSELENGTSALLAPGPEFFVSRRKIINEEPVQHSELRTRGLQLTLPLVRQSAGTLWAVLPYRYEAEVGKRIAIEGYRHVASDGYEVFATKEDLKTVLKRFYCRLPQRKVLMMDASSPYEDRERRETFYHDFCCLHADMLLSHGFEIIHGEAQNGSSTWNGEALISEVATNGLPVLRKFGIVHQEHQEAFIIMLAILEIEDAWKDQLFLCAKAKPANVSIPSWLTANGLYEAFDHRSLPRGTLEDQRRIVDGENEWVCIRPMSAKCKYTYFSLRLLSGSCVRAVWIGVNFINTFGYQERATRLHIIPHTEENWNFAPEKHHAAEGLGDFEIIETGCLLT